MAISAKTGHETAGKRSNPPKFESTRRTGMIQFLIRIRAGQNARARRVASIPEPCQNLDKYQKTLSVDTHLLQDPVT